MQKISIKGIFNRYEFGVNNVKYILGNNYQNKYDLINTIRKVFNKVEDSEFLFESNINTYFKINDEPINIRKTKFYEVNNFYNLSDEFKLRSNSTVLSFLEQLFLDIEYNDLVNTINILQQDLATEMSKIVNEEINKYNMNISIEDINIKNLLKRIEIKMSKDNLSSNQYDLNYNENIIGQIELIEIISKKNKLYNHLALIDIPVITPDITNKLNQINNNNLILIVVSNDYRLNNFNININDCYIINKVLIDLSDDISLYNDIIMELPTKITLEEIKLSLNNYINNLNWTDNIKIGDIL